MLPLPLDWTLKEWRDCVVQEFGDGNAATRFLDGKIAHQGEGQRVVNPMGMLQVLTDLMVKEMDAKIFGPAPEEPVC